MIERSRRPAGQERTEWVEPPPVCSKRLSVRATTRFCDASRSEGTEGSSWSRERIIEFRTGRRCAAEALKEAGASALDVGVGPHREPLWPAGFVGSITHSRAFAFAAVGRSGEVGSVGVDSEPILDEASLVSVEALTFLPGERQRVSGRLDLATAIFSAKEALFKCLYPLVGVFFDYLDARVASLQIAGGRGSCLLLLRRDLGPRFRAGNSFLARIALEGGHAHTCVELDPSFS